MSGATKPRTGAEVLAEMVPLGGRRVIDVGSGAGELASTSFMSQMRLPNAEALAARVIGVDPSRAARLHAHRDEFIARFAALATRDGDTYCFDQENRVALFRRMARSR